MRHDTARRVELTIKRLVTLNGRQLCPFDSRIIGSAPWVCIVCNMVRSKIKGTNIPEIIVTGGNSRDPRGPVRRWWRRPWLYNYFDANIYTYIQTYRGRVNRYLGRDVIIDAHEYIPEHLKLVITGNSMYTIRHIYTGINSKYRALFAAEEKEEKKIERKPR